MMTQVSSKVGGMLTTYSMKALCEQADLILEGHVVQTNVSTGVVKVTDRFSLVYADHKVRVDNTLKRPAYSVGTHVTLRTMGGAFGDLSMVVNGEASFADGENVIVFVTRDFPQALPVGVFTILGGFQGKFMVKGAGPEGVVSRARTKDQSLLSNFRREIQTNLGQTGFLMASG